MATRFVHPVEQRAEDDPDRLGVLSRVERRVDEDVELARERVLGAKRVSADQAGKRWDREPRVALPASP
jgi:hypothetical protein